MAHPHRFSLPLLLAMALTPALAAAQAFSGTGPATTEFFPLDRGMIVVEMEHPGTGGRFSVQLREVETGGSRILVRESPPYEGVQMHRVPRAGSYLFEVTATGDWSVRVRREAEVEDPLLQGMLEGDRAGSAGPLPFGWVAAGLLGGTVTGPLGTFVATSLAGRSSVAVPPGHQGTMSGRDAEFARGFQQGFEERFRSRRRDAALSGGLLGSTFFLFAAIATVASSSRGGASDGSDGGGGTPAPALVPGR